MQQLRRGSYTLAEAAELLGPTAPDPAQVAALSRAGELLAFEHEDETLLPKYQFSGRGPVGHSFFHQNRP
jgi:hypothetical protein